jgi:hypothetical protein
VNDPKFVIQVSKGLIRDQRSRRTLMFYSVLVVLVLIFAGSTLLWSWLREHPLVFVAYWFGCAWVTLLAVLLALYDMAKVRGDAVRERRRLQGELHGKADHENPHDPHAR